MGPGQGFPMLPLTKIVECLGPAKLLYPKNLYRAFIRPEDGGVCLS